MDIIKIIGVGLIAVIVITVLKQYKPEFTVYISICAGAIILGLVMTRVSAVIQLLTELSNKVSDTNGFLKILIKITGIAFLTEFAVNICKDAGESAIASKVDLGGKVIIISMSVPIISELLETIVKVLP